MVSVLFLLFSVLYHLMYHPHTYGIYIELLEGERILYVNEGRVQAHKDSAVVGIGLERYRRVRSLYLSHTTRSVYGQS